MDEPFYKNGLSFECKKCSACCRYEPGYVYLNETDITRLIKETGLKKDEFLNNYCKTIYIGNLPKISLKEYENNDCIFWEGGGCKVYNSRPMQCRSFPFWEKNIVSIEKWNELEKSCPGVNKGRLYSQKEIEMWIKYTRKNKY